MKKDNKSDRKRKQPMFLWRGKTMNSVILNKARNYADMLCTLRNQHTLPSLFKLVTESILIFIAISTFLIVAMAL
jgi:hypothetical protein